MQANAQPFGFLKSKSSVVIPFFQRPYVWTEENWEELLKELRDTSKSHFLGSIILKNQSNNEGNPYWLVIDGQQRLTTLSIMLKALYDSIEVDIIKRELLPKLKEVLYNREGLKIKHSRLDKKEYDYILNIDKKDIDKLDDDGVTRFMRIIVFNVLKEAENKEEIKNKLDKSYNDLEIDNNSSNNFLKFLFNMFYTLGEFHKEVYLKNANNTVLIENYQYFLDQNYNKLLELNRKINSEEHIDVIARLIKEKYDSIKTLEKTNIQRKALEDLIDERINHIIFDINKQYSELFSNQYPVNLNIDKVKDRKSNIAKCYLFFAQQFTNNNDSTRNHNDGVVYSFSKKKQLFDYLIETEDATNKNHIFVEIRIGENDNEQAIFDTINSAGVRLTGADIIKNALFQQALEVYQRNEREVEELYNEFWDTTFSIDQDTRKYWENDLKIGVLARDNMEILLHAIAIIKGKFDPDKHSLSDLSNIYKKLFSEIKDRKELKDLLIDIRTYAKIYKNVFNYDRDNEYSYATPKERLIQIISELKISALHPYILHLHKLYGNIDREQTENDIEILNRKLYEIERLLILQIIANGAVYKGINKLIKTFIKSESTLNELAVINKQAVEKGLESINTNHAKIVLFWLELHRRDTQNDSNYNDEKGDLAFKYTLEHIMPQKWSDNWQDVPMRLATDNNKQEEFANNEENKNIRNATIKHIGNMTLVKKGFNSKLGNSSFKDKIEGRIDGNGKEIKGMRRYSTLFITVDDIINPYDAGQTVWNEQRIEERTKKLMKEILEIWPLASEEEKEAAKKVSTS